LIGLPLITFGFADLSHLVATPFVFTPVIHTLSLSGVLNFFKSSFGYLMFHSLSNCNLLNFVDGYTFFNNLLPAFLNALAASSILLPLNLGHFHHHQFHKPKSSNDCFNAASCVSLLEFLNIS